MTPRHIAAGLTAGLALALASAGLAAKRADERTRNVPAARATGPAQSCIRLAEITNSEVRNDWTIDFERGTGRRIYRAVLDHRCPGLRAADAFSYKTSLSELCSTDIIHPLHHSGGLHQGPGCGLGKFTPMELAPPRR
jgi:hypothetical protein